MKYIYRIVILLVIYVGAVLFMSKNIKEVEIQFDTTVQMQEATFPILEIKTGGSDINLLHGYSGNMDSQIVRDTITPLDKEKTFEICINVNQKNVIKLNYEIYDIFSEEVVDAGTVSALEETKEAKTAKIKIKADLEQGKEYPVKIVLVTTEGRKIHYYTRVKYYEEESFFTQKMDFITNFHKQAMNKETAKKLSVYLEPDSQQDNKSLAYVTVHSNFDTFSWGNLKPEVITEIVPNVKEYNIETAAVELSYFVKAATGSSKEEIYRVKEFFRIRYTSDRMYLLYYQRTMEAQFNVNLVSLSKSEFKIGISQDTDLDIVTTKDNMKMCFAREGELWYYDLAENKAVKVFTFMKKNTDYVHNAYDQYNIRILNLKEDGTIDFLVYGYMNRGDYEGRVGILLYKFYPNQNRIEEQVYVPLETTYQILKEDLNDFSYVSNKDIFYFTMDNVIYSYNIVAKKLSVIASGISNENFLMAEEGSYIAWQNSSVQTKATKITLLDLETEETKIITAPNGDNIKILGGMGENIIYGYVHRKDIKENYDGTITVPLYKLEIADRVGKILKTYQINKTYVTGIEITDNIILLERAVKETQGGQTSYRKIKSDHIINSLIEENNSIKVTTRITDLAMTELYLCLPPGFEIGKKPKVSQTVNTVITEDTTLHLDKKGEKAEKYYVSAQGSILASFSTPSDGILIADEKMGVVLNQNNQIIWERGGKYSRKTINAVQSIYAENGVDSIGACTGMLLKYNSISVSPKTLSGTKTSIYGMLQKYLKKTPINLSGCTLDEVLYYVSSERPVIGMLGKDKAVLITGYDEYFVTYIDPVSKKTEKLGIVKASNLFKENGNIFISYLPVAHK